MTVLEVLTLGAGTLLLVYWLKLISSKLEGIPEPPCNFLLGHALSLRGHIPKTWLEWKKSLGPVFQIRIFCFRLLVLNDKESILKCCLKAESAGRWHFGLMGRLAERFGEGPVCSQGAYNQEQRHFYLNSFRKMGFGRPATEKGILEEVDFVIQNWRATAGKPFEMEGLASGYAANAVWKLLGSKSFSTEEAEKISHTITNAVLMDTMLQRLNALFTKPMEKISSAARELTDSWGRVVVKACHDLVESHFGDRVANEPRDVVDMMLDQMDASENPASPFHRNNIKNAFGMSELLAASIHTTSKSIEWFLFYVAKHPQVQSRLQKEIEAVVGPTEEPVQLHHRDRMPYAQACIYESLRMSSQVSLAMPHAAMEAFEFNGTKIPKGTIILTNLYAAHYDPEMWDQPQEFKPERFLTPEGQLDNSLTKNVIAFAVGRRACLGASVAKDILFIFVSNVYKEFDIQVPNSPNSIEGRFGVEISPPLGLKVTAVSRK